MSILNSVSNTMKNKSYCKQKMHILCDLDSTLINSLSIDSELKHVDQKFQDKFKYYDMKKYYRIFERPYLQLFLDYLFENFNVSIFTAADKDYALFISENIILQNKPERKLEYFFYGIHSTYSENFYKSPKDLRLLWDIFKLKEFTKCSTIIIDDLIDVYDANKDNTIVAVKFDILDIYDKKVVVNTDIVNDNFLLSIIPVLDYKQEQYKNSKCDHRNGKSHLIPCT
jgi:TFIIF-interacting CTD phosphatase-like protein